MIPFPHNRNYVHSDMQHLDPDQKDPEDRRDVNPPIEVESATWSAGGTLDWWAKERREVVGTRTWWERSSEMDQSC
jgi:hypothetical protein